MSIFVYADESGVFDREHESYYVFGGVLYLSKRERDDARRKYRSAENSLGSSVRRTKDGEIKATTLLNKEKGKLFRSLKKTYKFSVVISLKDIRESIFQNKKTKQRFLDYAFKRGLKKLVEKLILEDQIAENYDESIYVYMDEHTTATDGCYELRESLEQEFKIGVHSWNFLHFFPPILPNLKSVSFYMRDSRHEALIRAADIVANRTYHSAHSGSIHELCDKVCVLFLP